MDIPLEEQIFFEVGDCIGVFMSKGQGYIVQYLFRSTKQETVETGPADMYSVYGEDIESLAKPVIINEMFFYKTAYKAVEMRAIVDTCEGN